METYIVYCYLYDYDEDPLERSYICYSLKEAQRIAKDEVDSFDHVTIYKATEVETMFNEEFNEEA